MSQHPILRPGDPGYESLDKINRAIDLALRPHRGKPGVEHFYAVVARMQREGEAQLRSEASERAPDAA